MTTSDLTLLVSRQAAIRSVGLQTEVDRAAARELFTSACGEGWTAKTGWADYCAGADPTSRLHGVQVRLFMSYRRCFSYHNNANPTQHLPNRLAAVRQGQVLEQAADAEQQHHRCSPATPHLPPPAAHRNVSSSLLWAGPLPESMGLLFKLTQIVLNNNKISGPLPLPLCRLAGLSILFLQENRLSGSIPQEVCLLSSLVMLRLDGNKLTGPIPPELCRITHLKRISLSHNKLTGPVPQHLHMLKELQEFVANDNMLTGPLPVRADHAHRHISLYMSLHCASSCNLRHLCSPLRH